MKPNTPIFFFLVLFSCSVPIKTIKVDDLNNYPKKKYVQLEIFESNEYIEREYKIIAEIIIDNNFITGDLLYDERAKRYLLDRMNSVGGDALIIDNICSDFTQTCFHAVLYSKSISDEVLP